jgi:dTDP-glucose 4,6-dehydratase
MADYQPGIAQQDLALIADRCAADVVEGLRGRHLFVTGGTGFFGCWLLEALLWLDRVHGLDLRLTVLSRQPERFRRNVPGLAAHPALRLAQGDVRDMAGLHGRYDIVIHAATDVAASAAGPKETFDAIVRGGEQALALARRSGAARFLLTSSGAVYGRQPPGLTHVPEDYPGAPAPTDVRSAYGQGKRVVEWLGACERQAGGLDVQIARCFAFLGPYQPLDAPFAAASFLRDILGGTPVRVNGDGRAVRSYLYAADLAIWLLTILVRGDGQPYNVGSPERISIAGLATRMSTVLNGRDDSTVLGIPVPGAQAEQYVPDVARAAALGLSVCTPLDDAIRRTAAWHRPV